MRSASERRLSPLGFDLVNLCLGLVGSFGDIFLRISDFLLDLGIDILGLVGSLGINVLGFV